MTALGKKSTPKKRAPRIDRGKKINFRVTDEEYDRIAAEADGDVSVYARATLLGGRVRDHDALRAIAALHAAGKAVAALKTDPSVSAYANATLDEVRAAIAKVAGLLPEHDDASR